MKTQQIANKIRLDGIDSGYALTKTLKLLLENATPETISQIASVAYYDQGNAMHRAIHGELLAIAEAKTAGALSLGPK